MAANRGIMVGGPYRMIRHPMYAGYMLNQFGFLLDNPSAWNLAVYCVCWGMQIGRIVVDSFDEIDRQTTDNFFRLFSKVPRNTAAAE